MLSQVFHLTAVDGWRVQCLGSAGYCTDVAEFKISLSVSRCVTLVSILSLSSDYDNAIAPDHSSCKGLWKTWLTHFIYDLLVSKSRFRHKASSKQFQEEWEAKTNLALIYLRNYLIHITGQKLYWVFFLKKLFKDVHNIKKDYNKIVLIVLILIVISYLLNYIILFYFYTNYLHVSREPDVIIFADL